MIPFPTRIAVLIFVFTLPFATINAQLQDELIGTPARPVSQVQQPLMKKSAASLPIPFYEDFSKDTPLLNPVKWVENYVYQSETMPISPPTIGAAVFDGLDHNGLPYNILSLGTDTCDVLTSQPINLSNPTDSVYLSFLWQAAGWGEGPENNDSIQLQFFDPSTDMWFHAWSTRAKPLGDFKMVMVPVSNQFFQDSFQFRFRNFGAPAGGFDIWLIDYIELDDSRTHTDTLAPFQDPAFTRPHPSLLGSNYQSIPYFHYNSAVASALNKNVLDFYYQRNTNTPWPFVPNPYSLTLGKYHITHNGNILAQNTQGFSDNDFSVNYFREINFQVTNIPSFVISGLPLAQEFEINSSHYWSGLNNPQGLDNDTSRRVQVFKNYYAYDDGTAERGYQVPGNGGGNIVTKHIIQSNDDSIKGVYIYFFPGEFDVTLSEFKICIFLEGANGRPGALLYESDSTYTPQWSTTNFMLPYVLDKAVKIPQTNVFVGIRQMNNTELPIGFDRNNQARSTHIFYGNIQGGQAVESFQKGELMIRPYLKYHPLDLSNPENPVADRISLGIYPNPAQDRLYVDLPDHGDDYIYKLVDLTGKVYMQGKVSREIALSSHVNSGAYILRIEDPSGRKSPMTSKIIINR